LPGYVLDTSALIAYFADEPGAEQVLRILGENLGSIVHEVSGERTAAPRVFLPFMALMEFEYLTARRYGTYEADRALRLVRAWPVSVAESDPEWRKAAARIKVRAGVSVADAWNAALALLLDAELVHKDPELDKVPDLRSLRLPYKSPPT
jgi:predicted nucleic acid-binding protein